jgi:hypothetical protein
MEESEEPPKRVFFAGAVWGCGYYIGVIKAFQLKYGVDVGKKTLVCGDSAGSMIGLGFALGLHWTTIERVWVELFEKGNTHGHYSGQCSTFHDEAFYGLVDATSGSRDEAFKSVRNRLFIGITEFPSKRSQVGDYESLDELRLLIHSTLHVPFYCTMIKNPSGFGISIDGGYGDALGDTFDRGEFQKHANVSVSIGGVEQTSAENLLVGSTLGGGPYETLESAGRINTSTCFRLSYFYILRNIIVVFAYLLSISVAIFVVLPLFLIVDLFKLTPSIDELKTSLKDDPLMTKAFVVSIGDHGHVCDIFPVSSWAQPTTIKDYNEMRDKAFSTSKLVLDKNDWHQTTTKVAVSKVSKCSTVVTLAAFWILRILEVVAAMCTCSPSGWGYVECNKKS